MSSQYEENIARILDAVVMTNQLQYAIQSRLLPSVQCLLRRCLGEIHEAEATTYPYPIISFTGEYFAASDNLLINAINHLIHFFRGHNSSPDIHADVIRTVLRHCQPNTRNILRRILPSLEVLERNVVALGSVLTRHNARYNLLSPTPDSSPTIESEAAPSLPPTEIIDSSSDDDLRTYPTNS